MSNYGHIVYAGGAHGITLKGEPDAGRDGYRIVDVSRNLTDGSINYDAGIIGKVITFTFSEKPTQNDEEGYFYCAPDAGASFLVRQAKRGLLRFEGIEDNEGIGFKRRSEVNEALVGINATYPCQLIGSPIFSALDIDAREYYREESPSPQEDIDSSRVQSGPITREEAMRFAQMHPQEVRQLAYYLLDQLSKEPSQRLAVAIRDTEKNVRLWVAAVTYSLPLHVALRIGFNTRINDGKYLWSQEQLVYGVSKTDGALIKDYNLQNPNFERRLYAMIIGIDPNGKVTEAQYKQKMPNKPCIPMSEIETPGINAPYFADMVTKDEKILSFNDCLRDLQNCPCDLTLTSVYDAYCTLSAREYKSYENIGKALDVFEPLFSDRSYLLCYVMDQMTRAMSDGYWDDGIKDAVCKLVSILPRVKTTDVKEHFEKALESYLGTSVAKLRDLEGCAQIAKVLDSTPEEAKRILIPAIENRALKDESTGTLIHSTNESNVLYLLRVFDSYRRVSGKKWLAMLQGDNPTISAVVRRAVASEALTDAFLAALGDDTQAVDAFMIEGIKTMDTDNNRRVKWWLNMVSHNVPMSRLCALIARCGDRRDIEAILCAQIHKQGHTREIQELFSQYLANDPHAGSDYYTEWMRSLSKDTDRLKGITNILTSLGSNSAKAEIYKNVLRSLDEEIDYSNTRENVQLTQIVNQFASRARVRCPNAEAFTYLQNMTSKGGSIFRSKNTNAVETYLKHNSFAQIFEVKEGFVSSKMCESYISSLLDYPEEPSTYIILVSSFFFSSPREEKAYFEAVADCVCTMFLKKRSLGLSTLLYTIECISQGDAMRKDAAARILEKLDGAKLLKGLNQLLQACVAILRDEKTDGIAEKAVSETGKQFGAKTAKHLDQILTEAREYYQKNHKGGFFGKLFGKK